MAKTHDDFVKELSKINPEIEVIGQYTRAVDRIEVKCKKCGKVWYPVAYSLTSGKSCPHCSAIRGSQKNNGITGTKTDEQFREELRKLHPNIEPLDSYTSNKDSIRFACQRCGHEWSAKPYSLLQGHGCPRCAKSGTSFMEQLILLSFCEVIGNENVISRDKSLIGMELDIVIPKYKLAIEPGNWFLHKRSLKRDTEKRLRCREIGFRLITIYDKYPENTDPPFLDDCYVYHDDLNKVDHIVIHNLIYALLSKCEIVRHFSQEEWGVLEERAYEKSKSLTHEEFIKRLSTIRPDIEVIGKYENANRRIAVKCRKCGFSWNGIPANLLAGDGCRKCGAIKRGHKERRKQEDFENELKNLVPTIKVIGEYIGRHKPIKVQCLKCGAVWNPTPGSLLRKEHYNSDNNGCPACSKSKMGTPKKRVMNIETGEVFDSAIQAGEQYGTVPSAIRQCCRGKSKSSNGYHWKYIE